MPDSYIAETLKIFKEGIPIRTDVCTTVLESNEYFEHSDSLGSFSAWGASNKPV